MIPDFLKCLVNVHREKEMEYLCGLITDWEKIEKNIWHSLFLNYVEIFNLEGKERLYFKKFYLRNDEEFLNKIGKVMKQNVSGEMLFNLYHSFYIRDIAVMEEAIYKLQIMFPTNSENLDRFAAMSYHLIVREIINHKRSDNCHLPIHIQKASVFETIKIANNFNNWYAQYEIIFNEFSCSYNNFRIKFENENDLVLFKLLF